MMLSEGSRKALFYRRAALGVKAAAALIIAAGGVYQFAAPAPWAAATGGLQALLSVRFDDGNRFQISWGPETSAGQSTSHTEKASNVAPQFRSGPTSAASTAPQAVVLNTAATAPSAPERLLPKSETAAVAKRQPFAACSLGRGGGDQGAAIIRASMDVGDVNLDAFGVRASGFPFAGQSQPASYVLPILSAIRSQGAIASFRSKAVPAGVGQRKLPNTLGAVTNDDGAFALGTAHSALDLVEVGRGSYVDELNPWYHSLNAGMRTAIIGSLECSSIENPDVLPETRSGPRTQSNGLAQRFAENALYVSDGRSSLQEFTVGGRSPDLRAGSEVKLDKPGVVRVTAKLRATLAEQTSVSADQSGWNVERARYGSTRSIMAEIVVNGLVAATKPVPADGSPQSIALDIPVAKSSWVALRLMGAGHSNPVFVMVDNQPIQPSRSSVEWSQRALQQAYETQSVKWTEAEAAEASAAFRYAFARYDSILAHANGP